MSFHIIWWSVLALSSTSKFVLLFHYSVALYYQVLYFHFTYLFHFLYFSTQSVGEWTIYPWIHSNCNSLSDEDQLRPVSIPDILPARYWLYLWMTISVDVLKCSIINVCIINIKLLFTNLQIMQTKYTWQYYKYSY